MQIQLIRHATIVVTMDGLSLLVDPMLNPKDAVDPVANTPNQVRNPMVDLPFSADELQARVQRVDAVLVTHLHNDHWDALARELISKDKPIFCQPPDVDRIRAAGFTDVRPVESSVVWEGIEIVRTGGQHGTGEIGERMAPVSGFVLRKPGVRSLYLAGDTIWCEDVAEVLQRDQPDVVVVNAGAAQFLVGDPITMSTDDVVAVCKAAPNADVIAIHMEAINHCLLTRHSLAVGLKEAGLLDRVRIPADGEVITFDDAVSAT